MAFTVFTNGRVLVCPDSPTGPEYTDALAVQDGRVIALGSDALELTEQPGTEVIDLAGGVLTPAVGDGHAHPIYGALEARGPAITDASSVAEIVAAVRDWRASNPDAEWILGASYDSTLAPDGEFDARWLDEVTGDTPTVLRASDYHTAWVNSAALAAGNITAETPDPPLGRIVRREDGAPLGTLREAAANNFLSEVVPPTPLATRVEAIEAATRMYAAQGTVWVQDAWVDSDTVEVYLQAATEQRLHTRINLALRADPLRWHEQLAEFCDARARVRALGCARLSANTVKIFVDGVVEGHTAAMLEPYADRPGDSGIPNWSSEALTAACVEFAREGFQLHLHAIGDGANRVALDALEACQPHRTAGSLPNVIAHVAVLSPSDVARFAQLGVIANFEPYWAQCDAVMTELTIPHLGSPRDTWQYLIGSVLRSGAVVSFGSDWPVTTPDWRTAISTAITRHDPADPHGTSWLAAERISAAAAFSCYTTAIATQAGGGATGTLTVGAPADAMWLSEDPLTCAPHRIPKIQVRGTWLAGERTFCE